MADVLFSRPEQGAIGQDGKRLLGRLVDNGDGTFSPLVATTGGGALAADDAAVYPDAWAQTLSYNPDNTLATVAITDPASGAVYVQTLTYTAGNLTGISRWVKQ